MRILNTINQFIKNKNFNELEKFLLSIENLPSDHDGNPISINLLKNKQFDAIQCIHKIFPFDSTDLFFGLRFVSSEYRNDALCFLLDKNLLNPKVLLLENNISIIANENLFQLVTNYYKFKNEKIFDDIFLKTFFLKKEFNFNQNNILKFISDNTKEDSLFLFVYFLVDKVESKNSFDLILTNLNHIKNNIDFFASLPKFIPFIEKTTQKIIEKEKKEEDPLNLLLLEQFKNISLFFNLNNKNNEKIKSERKNKI